MHILKIIIAGFLVFLNLFTFLLIKCQKNDRERKILLGIAEGDVNNIKFDEKNEKPNKEEQEVANLTLESMEDKSTNKDELNLSDYENIMPKDKKQQKEEKSMVVDKFTKKPVSDIKLFLFAVLGGSLGIYTSLFIFRYRLRDIFMMVLIPTILIFNIYIYVNVFTIWLIMPLSPAPIAFIRLLM